MTSIPVTEKCPAVFPWRRRWVDRAVSKGGPLRHRGSLTIFVEMKSIDDDGIGSLETECRSCRLHSHIKVESAVAFCWFLCIVFGTKRGLPPLPPPVSRPPS